MGTVFRKSVTKSLRHGAELFTRKGEQLARWRDAKGRARTAGVTIGCNGQPRIILVARTYTAKYRDGQGIVREVATGCRDEQAARAILNELETRAVRVKARIVSAAEDRVIDHQATSLADHFEAYSAHQEAKGLHPTRISNARQRLRRVADDCSWRQLGEIDAGALGKWLAMRAADSKARISGPTRNEYRQEWICFCNWCVDTHRLASNPLASVPRANAKSDRQRQRRALTEAELAKLLYVARVRPLAEYGREPVRLVPDSTPTDPPTVGRRRKWTYGELKFDQIETAVERARHRLRKSPHRIEQLEQLGRERALIYKTLVLTGLRKGELESLTLGQLHLDGRCPYADLHAADSKGRQAAQIPLRSDLAAELGEWIQSKRSCNLRESDANEGQFCLRLTGVPQAEPLPANTPLFTMPHKLVKILDRDLKLAGIAKRDELGRTVDVHALRHCFGTLLSRSGVAPRTAQAAMRHSTIDLTMNVYTDPRLLDLHQAVESLPALAASIAPQSQQQATGTCAPARDSRFAPGFAPTADNSSQSVSLAVKATAETERTLTLARVGANANSVKRNNSSSVCDNEFKREPAAGVEPATPALRMRCSAN